jgi:deazaflavin-dependent oxidoreductase (nitroreductase family)
MSSNPQVAAQMRQGFKYLNKLMLMLWRLGLGGMLNSWPEVLGRYMVITHTGRKTGKKRHTPVNYNVVDGQIYCTAGFGSKSDWYRNVAVEPQIEVWLPDGWWAGVIEDANDNENRTELMRQVLIGSGAVAPLFGLDPGKMSDEELEKTTEGYCLLHVKLEEARTGPDGPGELAWIWPLATLILLPLALWPRRR